MHRITLFILLVLSTFALTAQAQQTMYVYHTEGVDMYFYEQVDSIQYIDSVGVAVVCAADSRYEYPVADIDSITFQAPPTIARSTSVDLAVKHTSYIIGADFTDGIHLLLSPSTPAKLLPKPSQCLYQERPTPALPCGFAARVKAVSQGTDAIVVECEDVELSEIFEQVAWTQQITMDVTDEEMVNEEEEEEGGATRAGGEDELPYRYNMPWLAADWIYPHGTVSLDEELADIPLGPAEGCLHSRISVRPQIVIIYGEYCIKDPTSSNIILKRNLRTKVVSDVKASAKGRTKAKGEIKRTVKYISYNLPIGMGRSCKLSFSGTLKLNGTMGVDYQYSGRFETLLDNSISIDTDYDDELSMRPVANHKEVGTSKHELDASLDGSLSVMGTLSLTLLVSGDSLKSLTNTIIYGSSLTGTALYKTSEVAGAATNNELYQRITATGVSAKPIGIVSATAKYSYWLFKPQITLPPLAEKKFYIVPKFDTPSYNAATSTITYPMVGTPMTSAKAALGVAIMDNEGKLRWSDSGKVWSGNGSSSFSMKVNFDPKKDEMIYPTVTLPSLIWYQQYGDHILAFPPYPSVCSKLFPYITSMEKDGIRVVSGSPIIGTETKDGTIVNVGNALPMNKQ